MIYNTVTKKPYVGQTINVQKRINEHFTGKGSKSLYESILKQRARGYKVLILNSANTKREIDQLETFYIQKYQAADYGYNIERGNVAISSDYKPPKFDSYEHNVKIDYEYYEKIELVRTLRRVWMRERHIKQNKIIDGIFENSDETIAKIFPKFESWQEVRNFAGEIST